MCGGNVSRLLSFIVLLAGWHTAAADDVAEKLKICAAIESSAERLACFDAIGRTTEPAAESSAEPAPEPPAPPVLAPAVMEPDAEPDPVMPAEPPAAPTVEPPAPDAPSVEPVPQAAGSVESAEMGAETIERKQKQKEKNKKKKEKKEKEAREVVNATITRVTEQLDGRWTVTLDNGQVWRESQGSKVGIPDEGASVELFKGRFGGYRMKIDGLYRTAWVQRTR